MDERQFVWSEDQAQQRARSALAEIAVQVDEGTRIDWGVLGDLVQSMEEQYLHRVAKERLKDGSDLVGMLDALKRQFLRNEFEGGSNPSARLIAQVRRKVVSEFVQKYEGWGSGTGSTVRGSAEDRIAAPTEVK